MNNFEDKSFSSQLLIDTIYLFIRSFDSFVSIYQYLFMY